MYRGVVLLVCCLIAGRFTATNGQARIVGGSTTTIANHPYLVSVTAGGNHICGGTIIGPAVVVTAAHCCTSRAPNTLGIRAGSDFRTSGGTEASVFGYRIHPRYNAQTLNFDLCLIYLTNDLTFSSTIQPITVRTQPLTAGGSVTATGWGSVGEGQPLSDVVRSASFQTISRQRCRQIYGSQLTTSMFCAGVLSGARDTCQGDSGGPLVQNGQLVGVTSFGNGCGRRGFPGIYTAIPLTSAWILRHSNTSAARRASRTGRTSRTRRIGRTRRISRARRG